MKPAELAAFALASMALGLAHADPFVYNGHWPSGEGDETATEVEILPNGNATIATLDDVSRVSRLTSISIGADATVLYSSETALTLSAALSGEGTFIAENSGTLTLAGDNSGLVSPGHIALTNSPVAVTHFNGLGSSSSGMAMVYFGANSLLDFHANSSGVFTNSAPLGIDSYINSGKMRIGVTPRTARLVQNASFAQPGASGAGWEMKVDGTLEFLSGTLSVWTSGKYPYYMAAGGKSHIWFSGSLSYQDLGSFIFAYNPDVTLHLNGSANYFGSSISLAGRYYVCERENALEGQYLSPFDQGSLDLNGLNQKVKYFNNNYCGGNPSAETGSAKFTIKSDKPAMLEFTSNAERTMAFKFSGAAGYRHNNIYTNFLVYADSNTTNVLDVAKGKVVLKWGAKWRGGVNVASGAEFEVGPTGSLTPEVDGITVASGGKLVVAKGATVQVMSAELGGTQLAYGTTYTVAQLRDTMGLPVDGDDDAEITVQERTNWDEWPSGGGTVAVAKNRTVFVSDADVPKLAAYSSIKLISGSRIICTNATTPLVLGADISGEGVFSAVDSAGITLAGDNSGLVDPGTFTFTNTPVMVTGRYGLGSVDTAMVKYNYGSLTGSLQFASAGLVCDAPITVYAADVGHNPYNSAPGQVVIGPEPGETLIFSNSFRLRTGNLTAQDSNSAIYFRNRVRFAGGTFGTIGNSHLYTFCYNAKDNTEVWLDEGVKIHFYFWFMSQLEYHCGWGGIDGIGQLAVAYANGAVGICERDNIFDGVTFGPSIGNLNTPPSRWDLNGHSQTVNVFRVTYLPPANTNGFLITSDTPATITLVNANSTTDTVTRANFRGAAALTHSWNGTNTFETIFSDTTGPLTIEKGTMLFRKGAGWGGTNVTIRAGTRLIVDSDSAARMFSADGVSSLANLEIENGGVIELRSAETPVRVNSLKYGGAPVIPGYYDSSSGVGIEGPGRLRVRGGLVITIR